MYNMRRKFRYLDFYRPLKLTFISPPPKRLIVSCFSRFLYVALNITKLHEVYILQNTKGPFTNVQNSKLRIQRLVAYEVSKVAEFFIVFPGG